MINKKKLISVIVTSLLLGTMALFSVAMAAQEPGSDSTDTETEQPAAVWTDTSQTGASSNGSNLDSPSTPEDSEGPIATGNPPLTAKSAILIDAQTGKILYERNADDKHYPASTTKIMTLLVALENGYLNDMVKTGEKAFNVEGSSLYLEIGEEMTLRDLLYGIAMASGNDATIAVAEHIAGSVPAFVGMMNSKALELGCYGTHFVNPNGLPDDNHYTTAHDLARIAAYAYNTQPEFIEIVSTEKYQLPSNATGIDRSLTNENRMLWQYIGCNGVKTGFTQKAGRCFVGAAKWEGVQLISVVLDADYMFSDSIKLWDYGFAKITPHVFAEAGEDLTKLRVQNGNKGFVNVHVDKDIIAAVCDDLNKYEFKVEPDYNKLNKSIKQGEVLGKVVLYYNDMVVEETDIIASESIYRKSFFRLLYKNISSLLIQFPELNNLMLELKSNLGQVLPGE